MKIKYLIAALFITFQVQAGIESASSIVAKQVRRKLIHAQSALSQPVTPYLYTGSDNTAYYMKRIRLQFEPFVEFHLAIFEIKIFPIIEFRWSRKNPQGWVNYKRE